MIEIKSHATFQTFLFFLLLLSCIKEKLTPGHSQNTFFSFCFSLSLIVFRDEFKLFSNYVRVISSLSLEVSGVYIIDDELF